MTAFFSSLVQHLARALGVRRVYVAECLDADHARARAVWMGSDFSDPFEYNVVDTPCMKVTRGETCLYANHVQQYFPQNQFLPTMNAESYLGIPLSGTPPIASSATWCWSTTSRKWAVKREGRRHLFCRDVVTLALNSRTGKPVTVSQQRHPTGMTTPTHLSRGQRAFSWLLQLLAAAILLQTLFFKFTGAEESVYIFSTLRVEPLGRIGSGIVELIAAVLLIIPSTVTAGATLALGVMAGAIASHLTILGIEVKGDGGLLFGLALTVFVSAAIVLFLRRAEIPVLGRYFALAS